MSDVSFTTTPQAHFPPAGTGFAAQPTVQRVYPALAAKLADEFTGLDLFGRVAAIRSLVSGRIVFTTSFGLEAQALAHAIFSQGLAIDVATLDTGRLFPETYDVWARTEHRYRVRISVFTPESNSVERLVAKQGVDGFRSSVAARLECCSVRKVAPLARILDGSVAWVTGMRAGQSADRAELSPASFDKHRQLIKANPLFDWTREQALEFVKTQRVPYNALHDRGFLSIGCAPCTRAVETGETERSGRWWWETAGKKECGLHAAQSGVTREDLTQV
ncbi:MAG TPA: phosphoadenylyl-sulfate reductase [Xanthobacteraceae bacterium]|jgi:phosphoadenosine phosphosulfate reductase